MAGTGEAVLVYTRIAINKRRTRWLIASFAVALFPVMSAAVVWVLPWISMAGGALAYSAYGPALEPKLEAIQAELMASRPADGPIGLLDLPAPALVIMGALLLAALAAVLLFFCGAAVFLIKRYGSRLVLRAAHARPIDRRHEPDLVRVVENLCIGAGLPLPSIHLVETPAANAFATGRDPQHASLVVTRGLLTLLERRELEGVIAHELSHIGNHDIHLATTLAALVGIATLPFRILAAIFRSAFQIHWLVGGFATWMAFLFCMSLGFSFLGFLVLSREEDMPPFLRWWALHATIAPIYAVFVAPIAALLIRQAVSRQREFLADADAALLTRDPAGLALALVKIAAAGGQRLRVGEGSVHLYFVDPMQETGTWLHALFPSHPPLEERVALLARMGSGIEPSALDEAMAIGQMHRSRRPAQPEGPSLRKFR